MSDRHVIRWNAAREQWDVFLTGEFARYCASFPSLADAERYVIERPGEVSE